jgi:hypothetical protein
MHNLVADALSKLERDAENPQDRPTAQCLTAILARTTCSLDELTSNFGSAEEETDYTFPMSVPCIYGMQENDKKLMGEIKKDNKKCKFKKIERTHVLT